MEHGIRRRLDGFWGRRLGCDASLLRSPGRHAIGPGPDPSRPGVFLLACEGALLACGDPVAVRLLLLGGGGATNLPDADRVRAVLGARLERQIGPAFLGYRDTAPPLPPGAGALRSVAPADRPALARLQSAVSAEEWSHSGLASANADAPIMGAFEDDRLLAAASFTVLLGVVAHIGVVTHPHARGRGAGRRVVAAAALAAAGRGLLLQYQTLEANRPSLRIAVRLGFSHYARSLAVRLAEPRAAVQAGARSLETLETHPRWHDRDR